jgi:hypothetical protein
MPRKKLTEAEKSARKVAEEKRREKDVLDRELNDLRTHHYPKDEPKYRFEVGDRVSFGAHQYTVVSEVLDDGLIYKIHTEGYRSNYGKNVWYEQDDYVYWNSIYPYDDFEDEIRPLFPERHDHIDYFKTHLSCIFSKYYRFGVNEDPPYQRGHVWEASDKVELIDSIFNYLDIGKFLFNKLEINRENMDQGYLYEVIDGKQRCRAILDFYENKFIYKGKYFYQLCDGDRWQFMNYGINVAEVDNYSTKDAMRLFLRVNTTGRVMDKLHLEKVLRQYQSLNEENNG